MNKTEKLKSLIIDKYGSIREFSKVIGIPSTTLTSALDKGIGGMAVDRVIKICEELHIDIKTFDSLHEQTSTPPISLKEQRLLRSFNKLNDLGQDKVIEYSEDLLSNYRYTVETIAAHNDFADDPEQQRLMKEDLDDF